MDTFGIYTKNIKVSELLSLYLANLKEITSTYNTGAYKKLLRFLG